MVRRLTDEWLMVAIIGFVILMVLLALLVEKR